MYYQFFLGVGLLKSMQSGYFMNTKSIPTSNE